MQGDSNYTIHIPQSPQPKAVSTHTQKDKEVVYGEYWPQIDECWWKWLPRMSIKWGPISYFVQKCEKKTKIFGFEKFGQNAEKYLNV